MRTGSKRLWCWVAGLAAAAWVGHAAWTARDGTRPPPESAPRELGYDGPSTGLHRMVVLSTLDTPLPDAASAVWCGSFQLAWNELKAGLADGPVQVAGQEELARRLNAAGFSRTDLSPGTHYTAAGLQRDGAGTRIRADMGRLFPGVPVPEFAPDDVAVAFAYLRASVRFRLPYFDDRLTFRDGGGGETAVRACGLRNRDEGTAQARRDQLRVMFARPARDDDGRPAEFALDLDRESSPDRVVVARVPRGRTLGETVAAVEEREQRARADGASDRFDLTDHLLVPCLAWRVEHRFAELEGPARRLGGGRLEGLYISRAVQVVEFRLDEGGADLASSAVIHVKGGPQRFYLDGPFLVYMQRRGAAAPYFAMWVDNAELLAAWK